MTMTMTMAMREEAETGGGMEKIRRKLGEWSHIPYHYQSFNRGDASNWGPIFTQSQINRELNHFDKICNRYQSFQFSMEPVILGKVRPCSYSQLQKITNFNNGEIQQTLSGRLFRGTIGEESEKRPVIVKTWDFPYPEKVDYDQRLSNFLDELELLTDEEAITHPNLVKLHSYCCDTRLAAVYDENLTMRLSDVLLADDFGWDRRMKVATQLAKLLVWLHAKRIAVGCVDASCIMIDEELNIKVFDFGLISHHMNEDSEIPFVNCVGREALEARAAAKRTMKSDVFIFGLLLLELITKKEFDRSVSWYCMRDSLEKKAKSCKKHLVPECFTEVGNQTALEITCLTLRCISRFPDKRPTMEEVSNNLTTLSSGMTAGVSVEKRTRDETELLLEVCETDCRFYFGEYVPSY